MEENSDKNLSALEPDVKRHEGDDGIDMKQRAQESRKTPGQGKREVHKCGDPRLVRRIEPDIVRSVQEKQRGGRRWIWRWTMGSVRAGHWGGDAHRRCGMPVLMRPLAYPAGISIAASSNWRLRPGGRRTCCGSLLAALAAASGAPPG